VKLADEIAVGGKTSKSGSQVSFDLKRPETLDSVGSSIVRGMIQPAVAARASARRAQQMNDMKQP
jgi:hypothetical protein